jgi:hypothetical protein
MQNISILSIKSWGGTIVLNEGFVWWSLDFGRRWKKPEAIFLHLHGAMHVPALTPSDPQQVKAILRERVMNEAFKARFGEAAVVSPPDVASMKSAKASPAVTPATDTTVSTSSAHAVSSSATSEEQILPNDAALASMPHPPDDDPHLVERAPAEGHEPQTAL